MSWLAAVFEVEAPEVEFLSDALMAAGALSVDVGDAALGTPEEDPVFDGPGEARRWKRSRVTALFPAEADLTRAVAKALESAGLPAATPYRVERLADRDWVRAVQAQFGPIRISPRLWIVPSWAAAPDPHAINVALDPGLAFGTGGHPTTRLCLRWLERVIRGGESVIDYGCGSGILAIAALRLGAATATGVDIDEQALLAARRNAIQNRVEANFTDAAGALRQPAQIVLANILARPLIVLAPLLARLTAPGGRIALAGLLSEQAEEVCAAYREWFDIGVEEEDEGWPLLTGTARAG